MVRTCEVGPWCNAVIRKYFQRVHGMASGAYWNRHLFKDLLRHHHHHYRAALHNKDTVHRMAMDQDGPCKIVLFTLVASMGLTELEPSLGMNVEQARTACHTNCETESYIKRVRCIT